MKLFKSESARRDFWVYFKRELPRSLASAFVLLAVILLAQATVASCYYAVTDAVSPEVPRNARLLVYKIGSSFKANDIIVFRENGIEKLGRVVAVNKATGKVTIGRNKKANVTVKLEDVIGRVVFSTQ